MLFVCVWKAKWFLLWKYLLLCMHFHFAFDIFLKTVQFFHSHVWFLLNLTLPDILTFLLSTSGVNVNLPFESE